MFLVRYNERVPKRLCSSRAEWRLQPGKPAQPLSAHYRLDCDYGTGVITCWEDGGSEPIYVCENHAKQLGCPRKSSSDIRIVTPESNSGDKGEVLDVASLEATRLVANQTAKVEDRASAPSPPLATLPEPARNLPDTKVVAADSSIRSPARDLTYGNPAKAMVDEAIWNMASGNYQVYKAALQQGKSATEAAEAAGGQLAMVRRKINDYTRKLETLLSESRAKISVSEAIDKPLEHAVVEIIGSRAMTDSEQDAAVQRLGTLQEWVKHGLKDEITPLEANRIVLAIGDRLNWGGRADVLEESRALYRTLYSNLKTAIRSAVPEAQNLHDRLTNLYAAQSDLETR
jgi:hypothetical protein